MVYAARKVNTAFILNVALDGEKKVVAAFAGDLEAAHEAGVEFIRSQSQCRAVTGDIVVTSKMCIRDSASLHHPEALCA